MSTIIPTPSSDLEAVLKAAREGTPVPADVQDRVERRAEEVRRRLIREGFTDCAVELIRAGRDDDDDE